MLRSRNMKASAIAISISLTSFLIVLYNIKKKCKLKRIDDDQKQEEKHAKENSPSHHIVEELPPHLKREAMKVKRREQKKKLLAMKKPMYDNIRMVDPDHKHLCNISYKKAKWYVVRNLGKWINSDHKELQLLFEPRHRSIDERSIDDEGDFIRSQKKNQCVACGDTEFLIRYYIVPIMYRMVLPERYKTHLCHDIVALCYSCNLHACQSSQERMNWIENSLRGHLSHQENTKFHYYPHLRRVKKSALALMNQSHKLPENIALEFQELILEHFSLPSSQNLTPELLQQATDLEYQEPNPNYTPGPQLVISSLENDEEKIANFVYEWRSFFMDTVRPQYLPVGWSVHYFVECSGDKYR